VATRHTNEPRFDLYTRGSAETRDTCRHVVSTEPHRAVSTSNSDWEKVESLGAEIGAVSSSTGRCEHGQSLTASAVVLSMQER